MISTAASLPHLLNPLITPLSLAGTITESSLQGTQLLTSQTTATKALTLSIVPLALGILTSNWTPGARVLTFSAYTALRFRHLLKAPEKAPDGTKALAPIQVMAASWFEKVKIPVITTIGLGALLSFWVPSLRSNLFMPLLQGATIVYFTHSYYKQYEQSLTGFPTLKPFFNSMLATYAVSTSIFYALFRHTKISLYSAILPSYLISRCIISPLYNKGILPGLNDLASKFTGIWNRVISARNQLMGFDSVTKFVSSMVVCSMIAGGALWKAPLSLTWYASATVVGGYTLSRIGILTIPSLIATKIQNVVSACLAPALGFITFGGLTTASLHLTTSWPLLAKLPISILAGVAGGFVAHNFTVFSAFIGAIQNSCTQAMNKITSGVKTTAHFAFETTKFLLIASACSGVSYGVLKMTSLPFYLNKPTSIIASGIAGMAVSTLLHVNSLRTKTLRWITGYESLSSATSHLAISACVTSLLSSFCLPSSFTETLSSRNWWLLNGSATLALWRGFGEFSSRLSNNPPPAPPAVAAALLRRGGHRRPPPAAPAGQPTSLFWRILGY